MKQNKGRVNQELQKGTKNALKKKKTKKNTIVKEGRENTENMQ